MKTPDQIMKSFRLHTLNNQSGCIGCTYRDPNKISFKCQHELFKDVREYIKQLEERNKSQQELNESMLALNGSLHRDMLEQRERADRLEAERDAAVEDMTKIVQEYGEPYCEYCGADFKPNCTGRCWTHNEGFKWRGVQKEE